MKYDKTFQLKVYWLIINLLKYVQIKCLTDCLSLLISLPAFYSLFPLPLSLFHLSQKLCKGKRYRALINFGAS